MMGVRRGFWLIVAFAGGCVQSDAVTCADGSLCAPGTVCDRAHAGCVLPAQVDACVGALDGDRCTAGSLEAICDQGVCVPGCGDGVQGTTFAGAEQCDDGNLASHDGCSSVCSREVASWERWESEWQPRARHAAAYMPNRLVMVGGADESGVTDDHWEYDGKIWRRRKITRPSARMGAASASDGRRVILFGGTPDVVSGTALGDTWAYDGETWNKLTPTRSPPPRWGASMAFVGDRLVLFGGREAPATVFRDTWELRGDEWVQIMGRQPPARYDAAMATLPDPCCAMLVGGRGAASEPLPEERFLADAWRYEPGMGWTEENTPATFPARAGASLAATAGGGLVLVGGQTELGLESRTYFWRLDGVWSELPSSILPPPRAFASFTPTLSGPVLVGGRTENETLGDVWSFNLMSVSTWTREGTPSGPLARGEHELVFTPSTGAVVSLGGIDQFALDLMATFDGDAWNVVPAVRLAESRLRFSAAFDRTRDRIVIFGGITGTRSHAASTQSFTGTSWEPFEGMEPPGRRNGALAYHAGEAKLVLFGGEGEDGEARDDTWTLATAWTRTTSPGPASSFRPAMAYDEARGRLVLVDEQGVTWTWTADAWSELTREGPSPRSSAAMTYSRELRELVLYSGVELGTSTIRSDLWRLQGDQWTRIAVEGTEPPLRQDPRISHLPRLRALVLHAGTAPSGVRFDDTWLFKYRSDTPDEDCGNGVDDDGDKRIDTADPDCE